MHSVCAILAGAPLPLLMNHTWRASTHGAPIGNRHLWLPETT